MEMAKTEIEEVKEGWTSTKNAYINTKAILNKVERGIVPDREFKQVRWGLNKTNNFYDLTNHSKARSILFIDSWLILII